MNDIRWEMAAVIADHIIFVGAIAIIVWLALGAWT
jgi:hypothetical protein